MLKAVTSTTAQRLFMILILSDRFIFPATQGVRMLLSAGLLLLLAACGDAEVDNANAALRQADAAIADLARTLDDGALPNQAVLKSYAEEIAREKPKFAELAAALAKEGSREGRLFMSLSERINAAQNNLDEYGSSSRDALDNVLLEAGNVRIAADSEVFGDALADPINVLADLSDGSLPRLIFDGDPAGSTAAAQSDSSTPARHLVGNPAYGYWQGSGASSFWVWYGIYRMAGDLFGGPRQSWYGWYNNRGPSFYGDVGRHYYAPASDSRRWNTARQKYPDIQADKAPAKSYAKLNSGKRLSTYAPVTGTAPKALTGGKSVAGRMPSGRLGSLGSGSGSATRASGRTSQYSATNTRSNPTRTGGFAGRRSK